MENSDIPSLSSQLLTLRTEHRMLDVEIMRLQEFSYIDQLQLQRLKRQKLRLKQNIERIKALLIPDLDA
ncbi:MAG: YdcH family protein [Oceanicoccus sp.]|uniref:YdcH family protein n=1 Tax=Oceanicoccus sp. TaxID=2691044 RepID=UPI00260D8689|nr:YdcH family protein [Oceanicoccus sp.]MCP3908106.1 YdcH family protein [Oceanicoccus sp.]MDG1773797.1 YdcH family protein [Oceanicoccus sp.]